MMGHLQSFGSIGKLAPGLIALALLPAALPAQTVNIRNDSQVVLVVQCAYVVNNRVRPDKPVAIRPGATAALTTLADAKLITVYDGRMPNKVLYQSTIPASKDDQSYKLVPNAAGTRISLEEIKGGIGGTTSGEKGSGDKTKPAPEPPKSGLPPK